MDEHGLVRLAETERAALMAFARRRLSDRPDEAEDAVQEALVKAVSAIRGGSRPENGRAWLFTILAHCCADARLRAERRPTVPMPERSEFPDDSASVARTAETRAQVCSAMGAIAALPQAQRQALVGYEIGGESYEELGARHGWSVSATKSLLWRARAGLAKERAGWAVAGGAPLAALRSLFGYADKPAASVMARWSGEALGCFAVAALGAAAVGLPASSPPERAPGRAPEAQPSRGVTHQRSAPATPQRSTVALDDARPADPADQARRSADPLAVVAACAGGEPLEKRFTPAALARAVRLLPNDVIEYTTCADDIRRALVRGG